MEVLLAVAVFDAVEFLTELFRTTAKLVLVPLLLAEVVGAVHHALTSGAHVLLDAHNCWAIRSRCFLHEQTDFVVNLVGFTEVVPKVGGERGEGAYI